MTHSQHSISARGFTLVELSIVLVIIGLLVGALTAAQSIIRSAEIRSIGTTVSRYEAATTAFIDKYGFMPGDFPKATTIWGALNTVPTCYTTNATDARTCDGNGDGYIDTQSSGGSTYYAEQYRYWQHMANAGLISGQFTGRSNAAGAGTYVSIPGTNTPTTRVSKITGFDILYLGGITSGTQYFLGDYKHIYYIGKSGTTLLNQPFLSPIDQYKLDLKFDDSFPGSGNFLAHASGLNPGCTTSDLAASSRYTGSTTSNLCSIIVKTEF